MSTLYIVATPIGNLEDITLRALRILKEADFVLAEDTRVTKKLFSRHNIETPLLSYHQHSKENIKERVFQLLSEGKNLALVTDAGTPGVSDPGNELVSFILSSTKTKQLLDFCTIKIVPIPGPSALTALASIAGVGMDRFLFLGYPPHKKGRKKFFEEVLSSKYPVIFYESPHRITKSLAELGLQGNNPELVVGRELTKAFETIYRGTLDEVKKMLEKDAKKGEFVLLVYPQGGRNRAAYSDLPMR